MLIIDAHLDLSMNALEWNRDLKQPVHAIREREKGMTDKPADPGNEDGLHDRLFLGYSLHSITAPIISGMAFWLMAA